MTKKEDENKLNEKYIEILKRIIKHEMYIY